MQKDHKEGKVAKEIEDETAKVPSDVYLWTAFSAMGVSLALKMFKKHKAAVFVGQWAAPILIMGVYNKIVKVEGSD